MERLSAERLMARDLTRSLPAWLRPAPLLRNGLIPAALALILSAMTAKPLLRLGTRGSPLALAQAAEVRRRLAAAHPQLAAAQAVAIVVFKATGDRLQDRSLKSEAPRLG